MKPWKKVEAEFTKRNGVDPVKLAKVRGLYDKMVAQELEVFEIVAEAHAQAGIPLPKNATMFDFE